MSGFLSGKTSLTTVQTADIANDAITLAKLAGGTDGNIISFDASGDPGAIATGSDGQALHSAGAGAQPAFETVSAGFTLGTEQATTSGTSVTFGSIPAGTKMIVIMFEGVSFSSTDQGACTIGDAGGLETSGYVATTVTNLDLSTGAAALRATSTADFPWGRPLAAEVHSGQITLCLKDSANFTWVEAHTMKTGVAVVSTGGGHKSLTAELTQVSISGGTFDAGSINIMYQ